MMKRAKVPRIVFPELMKKLGSGNKSMEQAVTSDTGGAHSPYKAG